jgi:hypothetical protein
LKKKHGWATLKETQNLLFKHTTSLHTQNSSAENSSSTLLMSSLFLLR